MTNAPADSMLESVLADLESRGLLTRALCREFHCYCLRDVISEIDSGDAIRSLHIAEGYLTGSVLEDTLHSELLNIKSVHDSSWDRVMDLCASRECGVFIWPLSDAVDMAWVEYLAISAANACLEVLLDRDTSWVLPDASSNIRPWKYARRQALTIIDTFDENTLREVANKCWHEIHMSELRKHAMILASLGRDSEIKGVRNL